MKFKCRKELILGILLLRNNNLDSDDCLLLYETFFCGRVTLP